MQIPRRTGRTPTNTSSWNYHSVAYDDEHDGVTISAQKFVSQQATSFIATLLHDFPWHSLAVGI